MSRPALIILGSLLLSGCVVNATVARHTTYGQELIDLQKAHASGAISDADYEKVKQRIISESGSGMSSSRSASGAACASASASASTR